MNKQSIVFILLAWNLSANAEESPLHQFSTESFSVELGATRVIYDPDSNGATMLVSNPQDYPILIQSNVLGEDKKNKSPSFFVTPPVFRLDAKQQTRVSLLMKGNARNTDRETLDWLCVKGVPPSSTDKWNDEEKKEKDDKFSLKVKVSVGTCIKILTRPRSIGQEAMAAASKVVWKHNGDSLQADNPTPFYVNLTGVTVGANKLDSPGYISPFSHKDFTVKNQRSDTITWHFINDYGGESTPLKAKVQ